MRQHLGNDRGLSFEPDAAKQVCEAWLFAQIATDRMCPQSTGKAFRAPVCVVAKRWERYRQESPRPSCSNWSDRECHARPACREPARRTLSTIFSASSRSPLTPTELALSKQP